LSTGQVQGPFSCPLWKMKSKVTLADVHIAYFPIAE
jgi:hypothetical protein